MTAKTPTSAPHSPQEPRKQLGRPVGGGLPPERRTKPRSVRLTDARWAALKALGSAWLDQAIDRAVRRRSGSSSSGVGGGS